MADRCQATILIHDDRFPMEDRCELGEGHPGLHSSSRDACEPVARLVWLGSYSTPVQEPDNPRSGVSPCSRCLDSPCSCAGTNSRRSEP